MTWGTFGASRRPSQGVLHTASCVDVAGTSLRAGTCHGLVARVGHNEGNWPTWAEQGALKLFARRGLETWCLAPWRSQTSPRLLGA